MLSRNVLSLSGGEGEESAKAFGADVVQVTVIGECKQRGAIIEYK